MATPVDLAERLEASHTVQDGEAAEGAESVTSSSETTQTALTEEDVLDEHESILNTFTLQAETIVAEQPRATQVHLTKQTRELFKDYKHHGSMIRLKVAVGQFLSGNADHKKIHFRWPEDEGAGGQESDTARPAHYGHAFLINHTSADEEYESYGKIPCPSDEIKNPLFPDLKTHLHPLRIVDPASIPYIATLPWDPLSSTITWPRRLRWPRGLLGKINSLLSIVDYESRVRLFHHISRYGPSPVFRVGIAQQLQSHYGTMFQTAQQHYLGFTPETRSFLRSVYETKKYINRVERRLLAQACRVAEGSIDIFWDDLNEARRGFTAMKVFVMAREIEKSQEARKLNKESAV